MIELPDWSEPLFAPMRYKSMRGGRGGAKSHTVAMALLLIAAQDKKRVLCGREFQNSIADSVHKLLADLIDQHGLGGFYTVQEQGIYGANGSEFLFSGFRSNITKIKSMEGVDILWAEEAQTLSAKSLEVIIPTIRKSGSELWFTWNTEEETDPVYQLTVADPPPNCWSIKVGWQDNPWLPETLLLEKDRLYASDPEAAAHIWGGEARRISAAQVLRGRWRVESFSADVRSNPDARNWNGPYYGLDFGFAVDPTALIRCWVNGRMLYIEHEVYGAGIDTEDLPGLLGTIPGVHEHVIRADSSRPETISHLRRHGFPRIQPAHKGPGSVEDGVEHLRSYEAIVVHPRCTHVIDECRLWSYKIDKLTGDVQPILVDKHNHAMDALRYALEPIIMRGKPGALPPDPPAFGTPEWAAAEEKRLQEIALARIEPRRSGDFFGGLK